MALGRVVTLDALGTLLELVPPAPRLADALAARDVVISSAEAEAAMAAEIAYYRAHHDEGRDAAALSGLRDRCAEALRGALPPAAAALGHGQLRDILLEAISFRAYPEVPEALAALRADGHLLVVVSNWDVSLHDALRATGLAARVDAALSSAEVGWAKPHPGIFRAALNAVGAPGASATHVGDSVIHDVEGARGAGLDAVLVARAGPTPAVPGEVRVIRSLTELVVQSGAPGA